MIEFSSARRIEKKQGVTNYLACGYRKKFRVNFHHVGWDCVSLGFHVCFSLPNIEVHLPFSFLRIGWSWRAPEGSTTQTYAEYFRKKTIDDAAVLVTR